MDMPLNLLDEALGLLDDDPTKPSSIACGRVVLVEDCVETSGAFLLHHFIKRALSPHSSSNLIFLAFAQPLSHYDRILRKMGCNLAVQRDNKRFLFFDMLKLECPDGGCLLELYAKIQNAMEACATAADNRKCLTIIIDDISLMEVAANGSSNHILDFLHYCHTLTAQYACSLVALNHVDIYSSMERPTLVLQMEYLVDVVIKVEPLTTGLATDVHGQLTILNKRILDRQGKLTSKVRNFQFRVKENSVEYFYPGSRG